MTATPRTSQTDFDARLARLREHYATSDQSGAIESTELEEDTDPDPMVTTSLRLPRSLLQWMRDEAEHEHLRPTALIRRWLEERREMGTPGGYPERLAQMESTLRALTDAVSRIDQSGPACAQPPSDAT